MKTISYPEVEPIFESLMDEVANSNKAVRIKMVGKKDVVLSSLDEYNSLVETAYLLRDPTNSKRLLEATAQIERGEAIAHDLIDD